MNLKVKNVKCVNVDGRTRMYQIPPFQNEAVAASPMYPSSSTGSAFAQQGGHSASAASSSSGAGGGGFHSFSPRSRVGSGHAAVSASASYGGFYGSPMDTSAAMDNSMHSITLQSRNSNFAPYGDVSMGMAAMTAAGMGGSASSPSGAGPSGQRTAGHVKIGRRPAHLPKVLKFSDKTLPPGWIRKLKQRKHGKQAGRWDVYIYSPCGVKFASRKKLKGFFEKNNLNYDPEDFDFTPYGRHMDSRAMGAAAASGMGAPSSGAMATSAASTSAASTDPLSAAAGRHNSSGSTGSDGTHPGSSPSSISNYSPSAAVGTMGMIAAGYMPPSHQMALTGGFSAVTSVPGAAAAAASTSAIQAASVASTAGCDYASFSQFDPHMEGPPNASALGMTDSHSWPCMISCNPLKIRRSNMGSNQMKLRNWPKYATSCL